MAHVNIYGLLILRQTRWHSVRLSWYQEKSNFTEVFVCIDKNLIILVLRKTLLPDTNPFPGQ